MLSSPVMRTGRPSMRMALPQKLLSVRVSTNTRSPGSPPFRKALRVPEPPPQPVPP
jgi:hypothetical protein